MSNLHKTIGKNYALDLLELMKVLKATGKYLCDIPIGIGEIVKFKR